MLQIVVSEGRKLRTAPIFMYDVDAISSPWIVLATASKTSLLDWTIGTCGWLTIL